MPEAGRTEDFALVHGPVQVPGEPGVVMRLIVLIASLLVIAPELSAQEVPAQLTLDEAVRIARTHNPAFRQVLHDVEVAEAQERQRWGALLPSLSASVGFSGSSARTLSGRGEFDEVITNPEFVETTSSSANQGLSLSMTLFDGGATLHRLREGREQTRAVLATVDAREVQLRADVAQRFYTAMMQEQSIGVEEQLLASAREQLEITQRRFDIGAARREEVLGAEVELASQELQMERARNEAHKARLELLREMGIEEEASFTVTGAAPEPFDPAELQADALVERALSSSPRMHEALASLAARERGVSVARAARLPTINASTNLGRSISKPDYNALFDLDPPNRSLGFNLSVSLPLFNRFETSSAIVAADAQLEDAREQLRAVRMALDVEVRSALIDLESAYRSVELAERTLALSQERLELTFERYRIGGTVSFVELQNATEGAARAERQTIDAHFSFVHALISLESKVGREVRP